MILLFFYGQQGSAPAAPSAVAPIAYALWQSVNQVTN